MDNDLLDQLALRQLLDNWAIWRDCGDGERLRTVWHDDGRMEAAWFQGSAEEFIRVSRADPGDVPILLLSRSRSAGSRPRLPMAAAT